MGAMHFKCLFLRCLDDAQARHPINTPHYTATKANTMPERHASDRDKDALPSNVRSMAGMSLPAQFPTPSLTITDSRPEADCVPPGVPLDVPPGVLLEVPLDVPPALPKELVVQILLLSANPSAMWLNQEYRITREELKGVCIARVQAGQETLEGLLGKAIRASRDDIVTWVLEEAGQMAADTSSPGHASACELLAPGNLTLLLQSSLMVSSRGPGKREANQHIRVLLLARGALASQCLEQAMPWPGQDRLNLLAQHGLKLEALTAEEACKHVGKACTWGFERQVAHLVSAVSGEARSEVAARATDLLKSNEMTRDVLMQTLAKYGL